MRVLDSIKFERKRLKAFPKFSNVVDSIQTTSERLDSDLVRRDPRILPSDQSMVVTGQLFGGMIVVRNCAEANKLYASGNFGSFVGNRMNFVNLPCFSTNQKSPEGESSRLIVEESVINKEDSEYLSPNCSIAEANADNKNEDENSYKMTEFSAEYKGRQWICEKRSKNWLFLSLVETLYLLEVERITPCVINSADNTLGDADEKNPASVIFRLTGFKNAITFYEYIGREVFQDSNSLREFIESYCTYRYFRRHGWVVRDGIFFGVNYMLYKDNVEKFHSSAAVRILNSMQNEFSADCLLSALQRELSSCKKSLFISQLHIPAKDPTWLADFETAILNAEDPKISLFEIWQCNRSRLVDLDVISCQSMSAT